MNPRCFLFPPEPRCLLAYTCVSQGPSSDTHAKKFVETYRKHPPGVQHALTVICNGGPLPDHLKAIFKGIAGSFFERSNIGWDIGGYLELAKTVDVDLLVCLGESVHFHRAGWLAQLAAAWQRFGPGMYGFLSSFLIRPHLQTSAFAFPPSLLRGHPAVRTREERYAFEHGPRSFWKQVSDKGHPVLLVTWDGVYQPRDWRKPEEILWKGQQTNCLMWNNHTEKFRTAHPETKKRWRQGADGNSEKHSNSFNPTRNLPGACALKTAR